MEARPALCGRVGRSWQGQPGSETSEREYRPLQGGKCLELRDGPRWRWPIQPKNPKGTGHEGWSMIRCGRSRRRRASWPFHVEGFVSQFGGGDTGNGGLTFELESLENIPAGFRAREGYMIIVPEEFVERFELVEPGKEFEVHCETRSRRKKLSSS